VTDPVDDGDPEADGPAGVRNPSWFDCARLPPAEMLAIIERKAQLDRRGINLFRNALQRKPRSDLFGHYIGPNLYQPGSHYIYTTPDPQRFRYRNWRPEMTAKAIELRSMVFCGLFSNTLSWIDEAGLSPGERTFNAGFTVQTIEFDGMPLADQLAVIYSGRLKRIDAELRRYRDYRGHEVVYSGGKSLHFHFCFDIRHLKRDLAIGGNSSYRDNWTRDVPDCLLRPAYAASWDRLAARFCEIAEIDSAEFSPDPRLKSWEQLRRCPWALRRVDGAHPLGLPADYLIRQPVLASGIFKNVKGDAIGWFHDPNVLGELCGPEQVRRRPKTFIEQDFTFKSGEVELFDEHAPEMFRQIIGADYPKFAHYEVNGTGFKCHFYNGPDDHNPSSFCEGNRSRILLQGRHDFVSDGVTFASTPNQIFDWIISQHSACTGTQTAVADDWIVRRYKAVVHDRDSLASFLDDNIVAMIVRDVPDDAGPLSVRPNAHVLIRGPQGCGKSTKTMQKIPMIDTLDPGVIFFSSPSIRQAEEKVETFLRVNQDDRFVPFLYLSLTALYERHCLFDRIGHLEILEEGETSWLRAIYERQHEVYEAMCAHRRELLDLRDQGKTPVLFGTHETMRQHAEEGMTRLFYARGFDESWFSPMELHERAKRRTRQLIQNRIHRVIVDEVTAHDLVSLHTGEIVDWVQRCAEEIGFDQIEDIAKRYAKFSRYIAEHPCAGMGWNAFLDVHGVKYTDEHIVEVSGREVPFDETSVEGIYARMVGRRYYVRPRGWWNQFRRVTMLTTEVVPTRIIEAIEGESASRGGQGDDRFKVYSLGLPDSSRDTVTIELQRACKKETLPTLVRAYHGEYPQAEIITDMVKARIAEFPVNTHMSAKGSNAYIGSDIVALYSNPSPALFGELGAFNTRFGRSDLVRAYYVDQFDQTTGRNRGYRGRDRRSHTAVFPLRLHNWLVPAMSSASHVGILAKPRVTLDCDAQLK
jgi:hypothetical protein